MDKIASRFLRIVVHWAEEFAQNGPCRVVDECNDLIATQQRALAQTRRGQRRHPGTTVSDMSKAGLELGKGSGEKLYHMAYCSWSHTE